MSVDTKIRSFSWVRQVLERFGKELLLGGRVIHHGLFNAFEDYSKRIYEKNSVFRSIVFKNAQKRLIDYYLPLTLVDAQGVSHLIDRYTGQLFYEIKKAIIIDTAGMGKSTLMRFMYLSALDQQVGIPIFFELRRLLDLDKEGFLEALLRDFSGLGEAADKELMITLLREGEFIFLLDGFDEIPDLQKAKAIETLNEFMSRAPRNLFIISSRDEPALANFADFKKYNIRPLLPSESDELIKKYAEDKNKALDLIKILREPEYRDANEFLTNPLLVSLLYRSYEYKNKVPLRKHLFYEQVFNSLFEEHDLSKDGKPLDREKRSKLSLDRFHKVMRALGFLTYFREGKLQYTVPELKKFISDSSELSGEKGFQPSDFLVDLEQKVPLLSRDGVDIKWTHKSIQEYFAADFIFKDHPDKQKFWAGVLSPERNRNNVNFISLYRGIDEKGYRQFLVRLVIEAVLEKYVAWRGSLPSNSLSERDLEECFESSFHGRKIIYSDRLPLTHPSEDPADDKPFMSEIRKFIGSGPGPTAFYVSNPSVIFRDNGYVNAVSSVLGSCPNLLTSPSGVSTDELSRTFEGCSSIILDYMDKPVTIHLDSTHLAMLKAAVGWIPLDRLNLAALRRTLGDINNEIVAQKTLLSF